jgi:hypothetical protein
MRVGRKGALVLLAVVVLWAATPALACLTPAAQHACCQGMMQGCGSSPMMTNHACCRVQPPAPADPSGAASAADHAFQCAQLPVRVATLAPPSSTTVSNRITGAPPPESLPGNNSILRI